MASLPTVRSGAKALYPIRRTNNFSTRVIQFQNGTEQRWKSRAPLNEFALQYTRINSTDRAALETFWASIKGSFDKTWDFTLSTTYGNCVMLDDKLVIKQTSPLLWDVSFRFRQVAKSGAVTGAGGGTFPTLASGVITQLPYGRSRVGFVTGNDQDSGQRYAYTWYAGGLTGFPTRDLDAWEVGGPSLSDADADTLEAYFAQMNGRYGTFTFVDPDSASSFAKSRFGQDGFERVYVGPNQNSVSLRVEEFN